MKRLVSLEKLPKVAADPFPDDCRTCIMGKTHQVSRKPPVREVTRCLERLHLDLMCKIKPVGRNGEEYLLVVTDQFSGFVEAIPLKTKGSAAAAFIDLCDVWETQLQPLRVTEFHDDQGKEFDNAVLDAWAAKHGVTQRCSPAYTPQSNGLAERQNLALKEVTICLMEDLHIPSDLWPDVTRYAACYLLNRRPRSVGGRVKIPYEVFTGHPAQYKHLRIIGSPCEVLIKDNTPHPKFAPRTTPGILLGYASDGRDSTCVYRIYVPSLRQVQNVVDAHILEPSRRVLPQVPAVPPTAAKAIPAESGQQAWRTHASLRPSAASESLPVQSLADSDRQRTLTGGVGASSSGVPSSSDLPAVECTPDASPALPSAGTCTRSMRHNRGVPAPRYDGSAAALEVAATSLHKPYSSDVCALSTSNQGPGGSANLEVGERDYMAEVDDLSGERTFDGARATLAAQHSEVLNAEAAQLFQRSAPRTLQEALSRPDAAQWTAAMGEELTSLSTRQVYELMLLPAGKVAIKLRWVYTYKLRPDGHIERYKARLVAKGFSQKYGVDFYEVWAPTGRLAAYRALLAHAAHYGLQVKFLDFKTAFLNGTLDEEIFVTQPPGYEDGTKRVMRLHRALYGLKQAANAWHRAFVSAMESIGYTRSVVDPAVFVRCTPKGACIIHSHVDDCAGTGPDGEIDRDYKSLLQKFEGRELGECHGQMFLGMLHERDWNAGIIYLTQPRHVENILSQHGFSDARAVRSPIDHKVTLLPTSEHDKQEHPKLGSYPAIVGSLMYIANSTRPDLCYAASTLARFMANPSDAHLEQAFRVLRYLVGTKGYRLHLGGCKTCAAEPLLVWGDSDFANCPETRRSVSGHVVQLHGSAIHWRSFKQSSVAKSTMIAEYYSASSAADEGVYFLQLTKELGYDLGPVPLMCDSVSAAAIIRNPVVNDRSKYAEVHAHFVRERVERGEITVREVSTDDMIADCMTKSLSPQKHGQACEMLRVF